jgi:hypothetical protein
VSRKREEDMKKKKQAIGQILEGLTNQGVLNLFQGSGGAHFGGWREGKIRGKELHFEISLNDVG